MVVEALSRYLSICDSSNSCQLGIVGLPDILAPLLEQHRLANRVELIACSEFVAMDESPLTALRRKKDSSIHVAAKLVRERSWDAMVSAGNTGALMAIGKLVLRTLPGVDRPALAAIIPAQNRTRTLMLDAGANVDCTPEQLVQFAVMASCYMQAEGIAAPRVGLLNIGSEEIKGNEVVKETARLLDRAGLNYIGNVEGTDIFSDSVDVVVCDGFVGNVALKTMEGLAKFVVRQLKHELTATPVAKMGALLASGALRRFKNDMNPGEYNGAPLLGLNGLVVKSHGSADANAFACAIAAARREVHADLCATITAAVAAWGERQRDAGNPAAAAAPSADA